MGHKKINAGLTPGGRLKEEALMLMKDKPADLIKYVLQIKSV